MNIIVTMTVNWSKRPPECIKMHHFKGENTKIFIPFPDPTPSAPPFPLQTTFLATGLIPVLTWARVRPYFITLLRNHVLLRHVAGLTDYSQREVNCCKRLMAHVTAAINTARQRRPSPGDLIDEFPLCYPSNPNSLVSFEHKHRDQMPLRAVHTL